MALGWLYRMGPRYARRSASLAKCGHFRRIASCSTAASRHPRSIQCSEGSFDRKNLLPGRLSLATGYSGVRSAIKISGTPPFEEPSTERFRKSDRSRSLTVADCFGKTLCSVTIATASQ